MLCLRKTFIFRLRMAAGWGITRNLPNIEYTYKWAIEDFDIVIKLVRLGEIKSDSFSIPGVAGEFQMVVKQTHYPNHPNHMFKMPSRVEVIGQELDVNSYFSVSLKSTVEGTKAAGRLEVIKEGAETLTD